mgnify:CR=1 FL=1|tara:strand:- start:271 stop:504 length:234 start_codon:yes stop_codon:yes gene_type:complete
MVQTMINLTKNQDKIVNMVKVMMDLGNKNEAIRHIISRYNDELMEPHLRPEFVAKIKKIEKEKNLKYRNLDELWKEL